jgi:hypothetical protein
VAARAVATCFASKGEQFLMTAVRAVKAGKPLSEITAAVKFFNDLDGLGAEWPMSFPV